MIIWTHFPWSNMGSTVALKASSSVFYSGQLKAVDDGRCESHTTAVARNLQLPTMGRGDTVKLFVTSSAAFDGYRCTVWPTFSGEVCRAVNICFSNSEGAPPWLKGSRHDSLRTASRWTLARCVSNHTHPWWMDRAPSPQPKQHVHKVVETENNEQQNQECTGGGSQTRNKTLLACGIAWC